MGFFIFDGKNSMDFGVRIEKYPDRTYPERTYESYTVPGRSGSLVYDTGAYTNVTQTYECYFRTAASSYEMQEHMTAWLLRPQGYRVLEDSYSPDVFRKAIFAGPTDVSSFFGKFGKCALEFNCQPQRWIKSGQRSVEVSSGGKIWNDWETAKPLIYLTGSGAGTLSVGTSIVELTSVPSGLTIDSDTQNVYAGTTNYNSIATINNGFPELKSGANNITFSGGITAVKIIPRWWTL